MPSSPQRHGTPQALHFTSAHHVIGFVAVVLGALARSNAVQSFSQGSSLEHRSWLNSCYTVVTLYDAVVPWQTPQDVLPIVNEVLWFRGLGRQAGDLTIFV